MKIQFFDEFEKDIKSKYKLCRAVSVRARELGKYFTAARNMERSSIVKPLVSMDSEDPLEISFNELKEKKIEFGNIEEEEK